MPTCDSIPSTPEAARIVEVMRKYSSPNMSDKALVGPHPYNHSYEYIYSTLFQRFDLNAPLNILEIGVSRGYSLVMWAEIFPNANIYGVDIYTGNVEGYCGDKYAELGNRVHLLADISQTDPNLVNVLSGLNVKFDLIIDDASHVFNDYKTTYEMIAAADILNTSSYYCIEDVHTNDDPAIADNAATFSSFTMYDNIPVYGRLDDRILVKG